MTEQSPPDPMIEARLEQEYLALTRERDSDFTSRMQRFNAEVVDNITPATDPREVYAALWALSRFMYDYADPPELENVDPSTVSNIGDVVLTIFAKFSGLDNDPTLGNIDQMGAEGDTIAARYMEGFSTSRRRSMTTREQMPE